MRLLTNLYEFLYFIKTPTSKKSIKKFAKKMHNLIVNNNGILKDIFFLGNRRLFYNIKKIKDKQFGFGILFYASLPPISIRNIKQFNKKYQTKVLKSLITKI